MGDVSAHSGSRALAAVAQSLGLLLLLLLAATRVLAASVDMAWDPVTGASGYKVYYGPSAGTYPSSIDVGNTTAYTVPGLVEGGTYHFVVTAYDASHTESGYSNDVATTLPFSTPTAQFTGSPTSGTAPLTVNFSNTSTGTITSYAWTFGDGGTSTVAAPSYAYATAGTYTVSLTVTGPGGSDTQTRSNYVTASATAPVAQFTGSPTSGTAPLTVNFSNTSTGTITSYAWTFGDGGTSTVASPSHTYAAVGTYTVSLTVTGPGGSDSQTRSNYVTVSVPAPVAQFTGTPTLGSAPLTVNFTNTSSGTITSYAWTFGDGGTSTVASPSHT
jgi:PKD repeat protein